MQRQGEVICLPAICRSSQRVDLQREGEPFDSSPLIVSAAALRGERAYTRGKRGFDLSRTADETLFFCRGGETRSASSDREQIVRVLNPLNHCQIFDQGEANGLQKFLPGFAWEGKKYISYLLCSFIPVTATLHLFISM